MNPVKFNISFTNELAIGDDGWGMIAPYGDFEGIALTPDDNGGVKREIAIQRMSREFVTQMVNSYNANRRGVTKFLTAAPIYHGHPNTPDPREARKYPDHAPKGVFANIAARDDGFFGEPILTAEGAQLVASRRAPYFSGHWATELTDDVVERNGAKLRVFRPTEFIAAALCPNPRLPVQMLNDKNDFADAEAPAENPPDSGITQNANMKPTPKIIAVLSKHGIQMTNEATPEQVDAAIEQLGAKAESAQAQFTNEKTQLETAHAAALQAATTKATDAESKLTAASAQFTNERAAHIQTALDTATKDGRITAADRPAWETRLGNQAQFTNELAALGALPPKVKTQSEITRGKDTMDFSTPAKRAQFLNEAVELLAKDRKLDVRQPSVKTQLTNEVLKAHPDLAKNMKRSAFNTPKS
jgi:hypothetical protein